MLAHDTGLTLWRTSGIVVSWSLGQKNFKAQRKLQGSYKHITHWLLLRLIKYQSKHGSLSLDPSPWMSHHTSCQIQADAPALSSTPCTAAAGFLSLADVISACSVHPGFNFRRQARAAHHRSQDWCCQLICCFASRPNRGCSKECKRNQFKKTWPTVKVIRWWYRLNTLPLHSFSKGYCSRKK